MASKKIVANEVAQESTPTSNLVDAEQMLRDGLVDIARIKTLLYGGEDELVPPHEPKCMKDSTWNVKVLSEMISETIGEILRGL